MYYIYEDWVRVRPKAESHRLQFVRVLFYRMMTRRSFAKNYINMIAQLLELIFIAELL